MVQKIIKVIPFQFKRDFQMPIEILIPKMN